MQDALSVSIGIVAFVGLLAIIASLAYDEIQEFRAERGRKNRAIVRRNMMGD